MPLSLNDAWILLGLGLSGTALVIAALRALRVAEPLHWEMLGPLATFHGFAWSQFGQALALALPATAGLMPLCFEVLSDMPGGRSAFLYFGAVCFAAFAILFYFAGTIGGFFGYARHVRARPTGGRINIYSQFAAVMIVSAPLIYFFAAHLAVPIGLIASLIGRSVQVLYLGA